MKHPIIWLSHPLSADTPAYGGGEGMNIERITQIAAGNTANTSRFIFPNHLGTHIDAPHHFFDSGATVMDYPPEFWIFDNPLLVDVPGKDGYLISSKDVSEKLTSETDLLLTGRTSKMAPDVDGRVLINKGNGTVGEILKVKITEAHTYDLVGEII